MSLFWRDCVHSIAVSAIFPTMASLSRWRRALSRPLTFPGVTLTGWIENTRSLWAEGRLWSTSHLSTQRATTTSWRSEMQMERYSCLITPADECQRRLSASPTGSSLHSQPTAPTLTKDGDLLGTIRSERTIKTLMIVFDFFVFHILI